MVTLQLDASKLQRAAHADLLFQPHPVREYLLEIDVLAAEREGGVYYRAAGRIPSLRSALPHLRDALNGTGWI